MRKLIENKEHHSLIRDSSEKNQRINTLIDTVFGIAVTLTIFNVANPNTFDSLLNFTQTLPAFIFSIAILYMIWKEIVEFSTHFHINDFLLNSVTLFLLSLIIFFVFPLRFLMLNLSNLFFKTDIELSIRSNQIDDLMIYYGGFLIAIYALLLLLYLIVNNQKKKRMITDYETFYITWNIKKFIIYITVPIVSILVVLIGKKGNLQYAIIISGFLYAIYGILFAIWATRFDKKDKEWKKKMNS